jgi:hypothetical protein
MVYPFVDKRKLKSVNAKYQSKVEYWASSNQAKVGYWAYSNQTKVGYWAYSNQTKVGYWASSNHFQDYKIYGNILIIMFILQFLNNLRQLHGDNPWLAHQTNRNFKM